MSRTTLESAVRLLIHARNNHGSRRAWIRAAVHSDLQLLRRLS